MIPLLLAMFPEIVLCAFGGLLMLMGTSTRQSVRALTAVFALAALIFVGISQTDIVMGHQFVADFTWKTVRVGEFARYVKLLSSGIGVLLLLLAWPNKGRARGNAALDYGGEAGEFYGLMLLSIAGIFLVAAANDIMLLFLGIELAAIPTYIMVSISRPLPVAQEAGVKYFFLGAMAAAVTLFGFSYLYGSTGTVKLDEMRMLFQQHPGLNAWQMLALVMLIIGFAFKMAAVPMHVYAGDVYQGAATPVTAFLSFVPKISGFVALVKVLFAVTGGTWAAPPQIVQLLWILSVLTMTVGNVLGLVQSSNIKRVLAYSSIAHTGYMLAGVTALVATTDPEVQSSALHGVMFYLTAYGLMNIGAFGVLILIPGRSNLPATSAETYDDLAGQGRAHPLLGLAMAVSCFSLIGLPLTVGFFGKLFLILPVYNAHLNWLVILLVVNAAISAGYYLQIVAALFLRAESSVPASTEPETNAVANLLAEPEPTRQQIPILLSVGFSMAAILVLGIFLPATSHVLNRTQVATQLEPAGTP